MLLIKKVCSDLGDKTLPTECSKIPLNVFVYEVQSMSLIQEHKFYLEPSKHEHQGLSCNLVPKKSWTGTSIRLEISLCQQEALEAGYILVDTIPTRLSSHETAFSGAIVPVNIELEFIASAKSSTKSSIFCEREFKINQKGLNSIRVKEPCNDTTLGGRVWDAAIVISDILYYCICSNGEDREVKLQPSMRSGYQKIKNSHSSWSNITQNDGSNAVLDLTVMKMIKNKFLETKDTVNIVELGCGTGFMGIYMHKLLSEVHNNKNYCIFLTDLEDIVENAFTNIKLNSVSSCGKVKLGAAALDWSDTEFLASYERKWKSCFKGSAFPVDVILATDVAYNSATHEMLLDAWDSLCHQANPIVIFAYKPRNPEMEGIFFRKAKHHGWEGEVLGRRFDVHAFVYWKPAKST